jgi:hypothetical protein
MKLNMLERIMGINVISDYKEGNFITFKTIASLKSKLLVNEEEIKEFDLRIEDDRYVWNERGREAVEVGLTLGEIDLIRDRLIKLNEADKLKEEHYSLYEKFVGE